MPYITAEAGGASHREYACAREALDLMQVCDAPPTPQNYELWLIYTQDRAGPLAREIDDVRRRGGGFTEEVSDDLASRHLARHRLSQELRNAGELLKTQLDDVGRAIDAAQVSSRGYGRTLTAAVQELGALTEGAAVQRLAEHLAQATRRVEREHAGLADLLTRSTCEVRRLREHLEQVRRDALTDALTGLPNRKAFDEVLERGCADDATPVLAVIDIDHFKTFNDTWGHQTGDQVIRYVASVVRRLGTAPRLAARYGGEEFTLLFPTEGLDHAARILNEVRGQIASRMLKRRSTDEDLGAVTISIGLAGRLPGENAEALMERADAALYTSKRAGRNRLTLAPATAAKSAA